MIHRHRFLDYVERFRRTRLLVVGPVVAEIDLACQVRRIAPDRTMPVYHVQDESLHLGAAALTAATAASLGAQATLLAPVGRGSLSGPLRDRLEQEGVRAVEAGPDGVATPELIRYLAGDRQMLQLRRHWQGHSFGYPSLAASLAELESGSSAQPPFHAIVAVDALPAALTESDIETLAESARRWGVPLVFDAAGADLTPPPGSVTHLIVNERESDHLASRLNPGNDDNDRVTRVLRLADGFAPAVLLTQGSMGALTTRCGGKASPASSSVADRVARIAVPSYALSDRRGVGFVLSGVYGLAAAVGADCDEAAYLACGAASAAAACPGPKRVGIDDLLKIAYREIEAQLADGLEVFGRIARDGLAVIDRAARSLMQAYADGRQVLVFGNGGSAAEANHLAGELTGRFKQSRPGLPAISLSANDSITTCIANDYAYDEIFARQIETFGREGDVAIGLSTSGRSPNVVQGLKRAKERGMRTIAFTGAEPGPAGEYADVVVAVPSRSTARIQEAHLFIIHVMCDMLDRRLDAAGRLNPAASRI